MDVESENSPTAEVPLIQVQNELVDDLSESLNRLERFLRLFGFCQYSVFSFFLSWPSFVLLGVVLPVYMIKLSACENFNKYQINSFEFQILTFQSIVAAISLICVSHNLRKYGVRNFLFVDSCHGCLTEFHQQYVHKIQDFFFYLAIWVLPCLLLKIVREVIRAIYVHHDPLWESALILIALIISWTYSTVIYLSGCALFNLLCNLRVVHFESYGKLLEKDADVSLFIEEHIRLTCHLSKISHRFRIFFICELLVVTASEIVALFQTTGNKGIITLINGGDFLIASITQLVGLIICLQAAAKTTHRAQAIASIASKWHAIVTCNSSNAAVTSSSNDLKDPSMATALQICYSQGDLEFMDHVSTHISSGNSYDKRQSFVAYLQSNPGGFSVFGWMIDRTLINTIFFLEISFAMFVLGKTLTFTPK